MANPQVHPTSVHICGVVVEYETGTGRTNKGVATTWLREKVPPAIQEASEEEEEVKMDYPRVPVYVRRSQFRLPNRPGTPVIMIGPGTGLAPFRGFIQVTNFKTSEQPDRSMIAGESMAEGTRQACRSHPSLLWLQKQEQRLHLPE